MTGPATARPRFTFDGEPIRNVIQNDKCFECGMGLCDPREWHPGFACETFKQSHNGETVWLALNDLIANKAAPWL